MPKKPAEDSEREREWRYSYNNPGFKGDLEFDMRFELLGKSVTRKARVVYEYKPEWEYFNLNKKVLRVFSLGDRLAYHLELLAVSEEFHDDGTMTLGKPHWVEMGDVIKDDVMPHEVWDAVYDAIEKKCKAEDKQRRKAARRNK
jgi:hypothetical protein